MDDSHILRESDIMADNLGQEVYFLLNLDGSLPFQGPHAIITFLDAQASLVPTLVRCPSVGHSFQFRNQSEALI